MINPIFLKTFRAFATTHSFTRTAELLNMTQPGVSQHLKWLEDYFGTVLIVREGKRFDMSDQGRKLLAYSEELFREHEQFKLELAKDDPHAGLCRFASPGSFGIRMYSFLLTLNRKYPGLIINFAYAPNLSIIRDVMDDKIDVGFVTSKPDEAALVSEVIEEEELKILVPPKFSTMNFASLRELGFINHPDGFHHASRLLQENFPKDFRGMEDIPVRGFINQITRIPEPVAFGLGFTALPEFACADFTGSPKPKIYPLKKRVVDPIYKIVKKHRKLPSRFQFILEAYRHA